MQTMYEALAREHMRELRCSAQRDALAGRLAAVNRWQFLERRARAARRRHQQRAGQAAQLAAVAD